MLREFDILERFPDGSTVWRASVFGRFETARKLQELSEHSDNEFLAIDVRAGEPVPIRIPRRPRQGARRLDSAGSLR
jgi:hypothetical protein